jgi:hypothetical protein
MTIDLLVLHSTPGRVRSLVDADALRRIRIIDTAALDLLPARHRDLEQFECRDVDGPILCLPIDGPRPAAKAAIEGLVRDAAVSMVVPSAHGGSPPPWWSLELVAGSRRAAVDLRAARWHDQRGVWWADRAGPRRLPVVIGGRDGHKRAADILGALQEREPAHQITLWLDQVAAGRRSPDFDDWDAVLCANYLAHAHAHVAQQATRTR